MFVWQCILTWLSLVAAGILSAVGLGVWCGQHQAFPGRRLLGAFRRLPWPVQFFLLAFSLHLIVLGSVKTNAVGDVEGAAQQRGRDRNVASPLHGAGQTVTPDEIARGWRLVGVDTNTTVDFLMPEGAVLASNWWVRGAFDDEVRIGDGEWGMGDGDWRFPLGGNEYDSLWALSWGRLRFVLGDATTEIVAVESPMSAIPGVSRFWCAVGMDDSRILTWENFALGRIPRNSQASQTFLSAQVELRKSGDFITRSNEVESVYRRVCPEDWDDDGLPNVSDPRPFACDGDFFGPRQTLPDGANANAYCWIELVAPINTHVVFTGDGESDLPDPDFMLRAGETNRVALLIGKTYSAESDGPLAVTDRSDGSICVYGDGSCSLTVVWPVAVSVTEGNGTDFRMRVDPDRIGGEFDWDTCCCPVTGRGRDFSWECDGLCICSGCTACGTLVYEGYSIPVEGGSCGCSYGPRPIRTEADDGQMVAGVSASFSPEAVIFEDAYTNMPGVVVGRRSTEAVLSCTVHGGFRGGTATFAFAGETNLVWIRGASVPHRPVAVPPGEKLSFAAVYKGLCPSAEEDDIVYTVTFTENDTADAPSIATARLTSVKVQLTAVYDAPENHNPSRHVYGVGEKVRFKITPALTDVILSTRKLDDGDDDPDSEYELFGHGAQTDGGAVRVYTCPISANYHPPIEISLSGVAYRPNIEILEPNEVITPSAGWGANVTDMFYTDNRKCWPEGIVGAACLVTTNYIGPMNVSFQGIAVSELPCTDEDIVTGCFTNGHHRTHTGGPNGAGAGKACYIQPGNFWFVDGARMTAPETNWIPDSTLSWKIPVGWHRRLGNSPNGYDAHFPDYERRYDEDSRILMIGGRNDVYKQKWHIDAQGTYRTDKFGHWISRSRDCVVILDGRTIQERHQ